MGCANTSCSIRNVTHSTPSSTGSAVATAHNSHQTGGAMRAPDVREQSWFDRDGYPFTSHHFELLAGRMHFLDEGSGPVLFMIHGSPSWSYDLRALIRHFSNRFRCIVPDHLGFALSDRPENFS